MKQSRLQFGRSYHIYNRGNNRGLIFYEVGNYDYFMKLYRKYMSNLADLYAYCLLPNHFHFLLRIHGKEEHTKIGEEIVSRKFGTFLGSYVKAINTRYKRTGSLFGGRYQKKEIKSENQFISTLVYIHQNPQKHGYVERFQSWPYSSYQNFINRDPGDILSISLFHDPPLYDRIIELHKTLTKDARS